MPAYPLLLLTNLAATWYMVGLIWFVQIEHYPQFADVGEAAWPGYHKTHLRLTTYAVGPPMLIEVLTAIALVLWRPPGAAPAWLVWTALALVAALWLSTALVQIPAHHRLAARFDPPTIRWLVLTNWFRTAAWSARGLLISYATLRLMR